MLENQYQYDLPEAGCDEAGRGCLAGPVFAAAVMLPPDFHDPLLNDSKQMTERNREKLRAVIEREAVAWAVEAVSAARIDEINILNASFEGMSLAVARLDPAPAFLAIDATGSAHVSKFPGAASSRAMANTPTLPRLRCLPKPIVTSTCSASPKSFPNTAGRRTRAIRRASIGWRSASTASRPTTG